MPTACDDLVCAHLPLVRHVVRRVARRVPRHVDIEDLVSAGTEGLLRAAARYDPGRGVAFSTYAGCTIRGAVLDALRDMDPLARPTRTRVARIEEAEARLADRWGAHVPPDVLAGDLGLSDDEVRDAFHMRRACAAVSLDEDRGDGRLAQSLADPDAADVAGRLLLAEAHRVIREEVLALPEADRRVILLHYAEGLRLREIARVLGVTVGRVSQIHVRAIERLRAAARRRGL